MANKKKNLQLSEKEQSFVIQQIQSRYSICENRQNAIFSKFRDYYEYYRGTVAWPDENVWRSKVFVPYIKQIVDTVQPRLVSQDPIINVLPREEDDIKDSQMMDELIKYQWEYIKMYEKIKMWVKTGLIYGVGVVKLGWDFTKTGDDTKDAPWISPISNYDFYIAPDASNTDDASYCIYKQERDLYDLKKNPNYVNLDRLEEAQSQNENEYKTAEQGSLSRSTPKKDSRKKLVVYEYYGKLATKEDSAEEDWFIVTANNEFILRAEKLEEVFPCGKPFVSFMDDPMPLDYWAIGEVEPLIPMQDELNTLRNQRLDNRKLIINHMWSVNKNAGIDWDDFVSRPGGIVEHDGTQNAVTPIIIPDTTQGSVQEESIIKQDMDRTSGIFPGMMGQIQKPSGADGDVNSTARGFLSAIEQAGTKMQYKVDNLDDAIRKLGEKLLKLNQKYIKKDQVIRIVGKQGIQFKKIPAEAIAKSYDFRVEGGSTQPQNKQVLTQKYMQLLSLMANLSQAPLEESTPGEQPKPTKVNLKYYMDNLIEQMDLPNIEEAYITPEAPAGPPMPPGMAGQTAQGISPEQYGQATQNAGGGVGTAQDALPAL